MFSVVVFFYSCFLFSFRFVLFFLCLFFVLLLLLLFGSVVFLFLCFFFFSLFFCLVFFFFCWLFVVIWRDGVVGVSIIILCHCVLSCRESLTRGRNRSFRCLGLCSLVRVFLQVLVYHGFLFVLFFVFFWFFFFFGGGGVLSFLVGFIFLLDIYLIIMLLIC